MTTHRISGNFNTDLAINAPTLVKNNILLLQLEANISPAYILIFLPVIVAVILQIKTIEQNIDLKQFKGTPRSVAV